MRVLILPGLFLAVLAGCSSPSFEIGRADAANDIEFVEDSDGPDEDTAPSEDADEPDTTIADSGTPPIDSGVRVDSGKADTYVKPDSYMPPMDSYMPPMDSYVPPMDSYVPPMDSYVPPMDSYVPPMDSYVPPMDSYSFDVLTPGDTGDKCSGVACIGTMTCCPYTGMCYEPACLGCCMPVAGGGG